MRITGNPALLERLVQNLIDNGVRHNIAEDGWVRVGSGTRPDGSVVLEVSNTGPVVPKYEIPSLFEPFRRLGGERLSGGAGLGLSIVKAIAHTHGGDVSAAPRRRPDRRGPGGQRADLRSETGVAPPGPRRRVALAGPRRRVALAGSAP